MLGEAGLALALDDLPPAAGVLTPATGIGAGLADRLRAPASLDRAVAASGAVLTDSATFITWQTSSDTSD